MMGQSTDEELRRRQRVADMMLTMHAILRDRYKWRATLLDIGVFAASTFLCATTFLDPSLVRGVGLSIDAVRVITGICSVVLFFLSILALIVDWKQKASQHQHACRSLSDVKAKTRELLAAPQNDSSRSTEEFLRASAFIMSELPPVPDAQFAALKAKHKKKLALSDLLDSHPTAPLWILRMRLTFSGIKRALTSSKVERDEA
jgi:hypothetical protein